MLTSPAVSLILNSTVAVQEGTPTDAFRLSLGGRNRGVWCGEKKKEDSIWAGHNP